jgi:5'-nucleotidase
MKFLLTNDDGIHAEGLAALQRAMSPLGDLRVVAPRDPFSSCGHQITTHRPLTVEKLSERHHSVDGSPADCARLGLLCLETDVDWLVSGINAGGNLGVDIHMSGTVAAAREAALLGRPAIAFSQYRDRGTDFDWQCAGEMAVRVFRHVLELPLPPAHFWNVNFPDLHGQGGAPEIVLCEPDIHPLAIVYEQQDGKFHYRGVYQQRKYRPKTDVDHCFGGAIAVSRVSAGILSCI